MLRISHIYILKILQYCQCGRFLINHCGAFYEIVRIDTIFQFSLSVYIHIFENVWNKWNSDSGRCLGIDIRGVLEISFLRYKASENSDVVLMQGSRKVLPHTPDNERGQKKREQINIMPESKHRNCKKGRRQKDKTDAKTKPQTRLQITTRTEAKKAKMNCKQNNDTWQKLARNTYCKRNLKIKEAE